MARPYAHGTGGPGHLQASGATASPADGPPPPPLAVLPLGGPWWHVRVRRRLNRFAVEVEGDELGGPSGPWVLHLPNSGRMEELLQPGTPGLARRRSGEDRLTQGELVMVRYHGRWVSVDARLPNRLLAACLAAGTLLPFASYPRWRREVRWGTSRFDFLLHRGDPASPRPAAMPPAVVVSHSSPPACLVETKSCNLVEGGVALFPDAPTARGSRHLEELRKAVAGGWRAAVVWFVQRDDARVMRPHHRADPAFAQALARATAAGVEVYAYRCRVAPEAVVVLDALPVQIRPNSPPCRKPAPSAGPTPGPLPHPGPWPVRA